MKFKSLALIVLLILSSCKDANQKVESSTDYSKENLDVTTSVYPDNISKVFEAHGGLDKWQQMQTLKFTMPKESGDEVTTTDLHNRSSLIDMPEHTIGFDGNELWLQNKDTVSYKGNPPRFYYNLMFYFYAMPFVLADDGIVYTDVEPLVFEGQEYPGIKISYEAGVGESPDDEYIIYYNKETNQMEWLAYTVTYFSKEKSKKFSYIKYSDWLTMEGMKLPKTLNWYTVEEGKPVAERNSREFTNIVLSIEKLDETVFKKPDSAEMIE